MTVMLPQEQLTPLNTIINLTEVIRFRLQDFLSTNEDSQLDLRNEFDGIIALESSDLEQIFSYVFTVWSCAKLLSFMVEAQLERLKLEQKMEDFSYQNCIGGILSQFKDIIEPF